MSDGEPPRVITPPPPPIFGEGDQKSISSEDNTSSSSPRPVSTSSFSEGERGYLSDNALAGLTEREVALVRDLLRLGGKKKDENKVSKKKRKRVRSATQDSLKISFVQPSYLTEEDDDGSLVLPNFFTRDSTATDLVDTNFNVRCTGLTPLSPIPFPTTTVAEENNPSWSEQPDLPSVDTNDNFVQFDDYLNNNPTHALDGDNNNGSPPEIFAWDENEILGNVANDINNLELLDDDDLLALQDFSPIESMNDSTKPDLDSSSTTLKWFPPLDDNEEFGSSDTLVVKDDTEKPEAEDKNSTRDGVLDGSSDRIGGSSFSQNLNNLHDFKYDVPQYIPSTTAYSLNSLPGGGCAVTNVQTCQGTSSNPSSDSKSSPLWYSLFGPKTSVSLGVSRYIDPETMRKTASNGAYYPPMSLEHGSTFSYPYFNLDPISKSEPEIIYTTTETFRPLYQNTTRPRLFPDQQVHGLVQNQSNVWNGLRSNFRPVLNTTNTTVSSFYSTQNSAAISVTASRTSYVSTAYSANFNTALSSVGVVNNVVTIASTVASNSDSNYTSGLNYFVSSGINAQQQPVRPPPYPVFTIVEPTYYNNQNMLNQTGLYAAPANFRPNQVNYQSNRPIFVNHSLMHSSELRARSTPDAILDQSYLVHSCGRDGASASFSRNLVTNINANSNRNAASQNLIPEQSNYVRALFNRQTYIDIKKRSESSTTSESAGKANATNTLLRSGSNLEPNLGLYNCLYNYRPNSAPINYVGQNFQTQNQHSPNLSRQFVANNALLVSDSGIAYNCFNQQHVRSEYLVPGIHDPNFVNYNAQCRHSFRQQTPNFGAPVFRNPYMVPTSLDFQPRQPSLMTVPNYHARFSSRTINPINQTHSRALARMPQGSISDIDTMLNRQDADSKLTIVEVPEDYYDSCEELTEEEIFIMKSRLTTKYQRHRYEHCFQIIRERQKQRIQRRRAEEQKRASQTAEAKKAIEYPSASSTCKQPVESSSSDENEVPPASNIPSTTQKQWTVLQRNSESSRHSQVFPVPPKILSSSMNCARKQKCGMYYQKPENPNESLGSGLRSPHSSDYATERLNRNIYKKPTLLPEHTQSQKTSVNNFYPEFKTATTSNRNISSTTDFIATGSHSSKTNASKDTFHQKDVLEKICNLNTDDFSTDRYSAESRARKVSNTKPKYKENLGSLATITRSVASSPHTQTITGSNDLSLLKNRYGPAETAEFLPPGAHLLGRKILSNSNLKSKSSVDSKESGDKVELKSSSSEPVTKSGIDVVTTCVARFDAKSERLIISNFDIHSPTAPKNNNIISSGDNQEQLKLGIIDETNTKSPEEDTSVTPDNDVQDPKTNYNTDFVVMYATCETSEDVSKILAAKQNSPSDIGKDEIKIQASHKDFGRSLSDIRKEERKIHAINEEFEQLLIDQFRDNGLVPQSN